MKNLSVVDLSRLQFAITALYHFLFVPLTLGLSVLIAIMESIYVLTKQTIWQDMTKFWGILFGINFAMGVATGIPLEFQFGTNWAYYAHYVGDIFGSILALEGLVAFFLEATFIGLFFFGWKKLGKFQHLFVTWLMALGTSFSALWILIANAWMQNPVGAEFNPYTMRMELASFYDVIFNPVAQCKFVHTISAGYTIGSMFVLSISALYLLKGKYKEFAKRSMIVATSFGLASSLSVVVLGDESGYTLTEHQKMKLAAIEGLWETPPAPAPLTVIGWPDQTQRKTLYEVKIPAVLGIIATRSFDKPVYGIKELVKHAESRIREGIKAYKILDAFKKDPTGQINSNFKEVSRNLGYGLLLKRYTDNISEATEDMIQKAAWDTVPQVLPLFLSFHVMVALGFYFIVLFTVAFYFSWTGQLEKHRWFLKMALWSLPLPWIAAELGWIVAECGRQPWSIEGTLPTFLSASDVPSKTVFSTLIAFTLFYTSLAIVDLKLLIKYIRLGPFNALGKKEKRESHGL
ncbi:MAG: cytochrome ubiquinol oxidase subunit I [Proteobacteria bacterium]|nr:cytochrome ubiquinol oxidase subunit I [Pseudomonadota bacterium]